LSQRKWPWLLLGLVILAVGIGGGWFLKSCTASESGAASQTKSGAPSTAKIAITIGDETVQVGSDQTGHIQTGHKGSIEIPGAEFEKLALLLRPPSPSLTSTWVPPASALLVSLIALGAAVWTAHKSAETAVQTANRAAATALLTSATDRQSDARSEWFRRFKEMLDFALSSEDLRKEVGSVMLGQHVSSTLATDEEKNLATAVLKSIFNPALEKAPEDGDVVFVVDGDPPGQEPPGGGPGGGLGHGGHGA
jgi:hypothetical protein